MEGQYFQRLSALATTLDAKKGSFATLIVTIAGTGASGSVFLREALRRIESDQRVEKANFIVSDAALRVIAEELGLSGRNNLLQQLLGGPTKKIEVLNNEDIGASVASGSYPTDAMLVIPCSMGTLAKIANGIADQLIERAADVCLKERRRLVLCVRETPFNKIHLRNMSLAAEAGATIFPVIPAFYNQPQTSEQMAVQFVCRVLQHIGLPQDDMFRWKAGNL
jgi:4-hydroxy-3-polyprenylbenzoate decarboxylase